MKLLDTGSGAPVVVIPGIQGRWEWMKPGIEALAGRCRVITFSLCDEPCSEAGHDERNGFACYVEQVREALDQCGLEGAAICGVSFGGLVAAAFAARYPDRTRALILASALPPTWTPDPLQRRYLRAPRARAPLFWVRSPMRMYPELKAAVPGRLARLRLAASTMRLVLTHPPSAIRMSRRAALVAEMEPLQAANISMPTLVITGDAALDRVVPVSATREYATLIPQANVVTLERTGHVGMATRPQAFADLVAPFVAAHAQSHLREVRRHA